ncbi:uncharacterized protein BYT42DRAFT_605729 [Radiomyces spectabilis]|uniref:uncharacterized protein n=1 Tax=Radiomyces spectabilis TaxID=64574 RepID=UPI00221ECF8E|nr:uncharacterized protein BYT42DRAFT_605729 [Radiomyces spectabilis]KAI8376064.1 hypothetical protein BYT42DRAFT_605729 [Radiomyces spectabilis]
MTIGLPYLSRYLRIVRPVFLCGIRSYTPHIGELAIVQYGPDATDRCLYLAIRHAGAISYDAGKAAIEFQELYLSLCSYELLKAIVCKRLSRGDVRPSSAEDMLAWYQMLRAEYLEELVRHTLYQQLDTTVHIVEQICSSGTLTVKGHNSQIRCIIFYFFVTRPLLAFVASHTFIGSVFASLRHAVRLFNWPTIDGSGACSPRSTSAEQYCVVRPGPLGWFFRETKACRCLQVSQLHSIVILTCFSIFRLSDHIF